MILRSHVNDETGEWAKAHTYATKADKCRVSAFGGFAQRVISEAATHSPALQAYLTYEIGLTGQFAREEITLQAFKEGLSGKAFPADVRQIVREDYSVVSRAYPHEIEQVKRVLAEAGWKAVALVCNP